MKNLLNRIVNWVSWHRRIVGAMLAGASVFMVGSALSAPEGPTEPAVVISRPLPAGHSLSESDVTVAQLPPEAIPDGALTSTTDLAGRSTAVALGSGTILQPALLAASHSTEPGRALVPITLRDDGLRALLKPGDQVTLITASYEEALVLTSDARVAVLATPPGGSVLSVPSPDQGALILVDVPVADATVVAALGQDGGLRIVLGSL